MPCFRFYPRFARALATVILFASLPVYSVDNAPRPRLAFAPRPELWLNLWRFNDEAWLTNARTQPLWFDAALVPGWSGYALRMSGTNPTLLAIPAMSADGKTNLPPSGSASLRFWFAPDWTSASAGGDGPGAEVRLLETGGWASDGAHPHGALTVEADGNALRFDISGSLGMETIARVTIQWTTGAWHQVTLANSIASGTVLCLDGQVAASGSSMAWLSQVVAGRTNGFALGSDLTGAQLAQGTFDELATFARVLTTNELAADYQQNSARAALGPLSGSGNEALLNAAPSFDDTNGGPSSLTASTSGMLPELYGCALWLHIALTTNGSNAVLTLNNTIPGTNYQILSKTNLNNTNWVNETNVTGASSQDWTQVTIPMLQRSNLFFIASVTRNYLVATNFAGLNQSNILSNVPDTMGAVGPNHFVELINGAIAVFNKTNGSLLEQEDITNFFAYGTFAVDPRILYDHQSQRWVACAIDVNSGNVVLAVTTNNSPSGLTNWIKHRLYVKRTGLDTDFTTLGLDANGIYVTVQHRTTTSVLTNGGHTIVAIKKPEIYQGTNVTNYFDIDMNLADLKVWTVQPAVNFDSISTNAYAWLVAKGPPQFGTNYKGGAILYRRLQWSNTTACLIDSEWQPILQPPDVNYRDYYDADGTNILTRPTPTTIWLSAPQSNSATRISLTAVGSRLMNAVVRDGFLYTCQHVGLSGPNGTYVGNEFGTNADRSAAQWLKLRVEPETLSYYKHGRIYDPVATNPLHYYFPSIAVSCAADILLGFSGSGATSYIGGYYAWHPSAGTVAEAPVLFRAGNGAYPGTQWGDYSATTLDPDDSTTFWTIQEYTTPTAESGIVWATWVARIPLR